MTSRKSTQLIDMLHPKLAVTLRVVAETFGTFLICFVVYGASSWGRISTGASSIAIALTWFFAITAVGTMFSRISAGHFNPAVTVTTVFTGQTGIIQGALYIIGQMVGACAAGALAVYLLPTTSSPTGQVWLPGAVNGYDQGSPSYGSLSQYSMSFNITIASITELIGCLIVVGVATTTLKNNGTARAGHTWKMALAYAAGAMLTYPITGTGLNPARSTGIALFAQDKGLSVNPMSQLLIFWFCPILAASIVGLTVMLYHMLVDTTKEAFETITESDIDMPDALLTSNDESIDSDSEVQTDLLVGIVDEDDDDASEAVESPAQTKESSDEDTDSQEPKNAEVSDDKSDSQTEADE